MTSFLAEVGNDVIRGGRGRDFAEDRIRGSRIFSNSDTITDFERGVDRLETVGFEITFADLDLNGDDILNSEDNSDERPIADGFLGNISVGDSNFVINYRDEENDNAVQITLNNIDQLDSSDILLS